MRKDIAVVTVVSLLLMTPFIVCARTVIKHTPDTNAPPVCTTCDVCLTAEEAFAQNMAAYGEGVRSGQLHEFNAYVAFICMGKPGCFAAFDALRAKYEDDGGETERE